MYQSKFLDNRYFIKKYNDNCYKLVFMNYPSKNFGFEIDKIKDISRNVNDEKLSNNVSRAKNKIFEYAACNEFDYFITLTLDSKKYDRYNLGKFIKDLGQFIRNQRRKYNANIQYLLIPEPHKDGAWHMHGLIKGIDKNQLSINKNGYLDWTSYSKKFGWCSIDKVKNQEAISKYITKYVSKSLNCDLRREKEKKLYYCSRGLKTAVKVKEGSLTTSQVVSLPFDYQNDYVKILDLTGLQYLKLKHQLDYSKYDVKKQ